jgi:hypothetical protein
MQRFWIAGLNEILMMRQCDIAVSSGFLIDAQMCAALDG